MKSHLAQINSFFKLILIQKDFGWFHRLSKLEHQIED